ncbi:cytochrome c [Piscinibacter aquaticus]|uniref:Cytochrome c n=1 Tax=Piscinibacter aquaticus TaxID=392597 RepID=A0A5C6U2R3_9BURK|nr:cytochrome c [Piscinibacter aquaticus]
MSLALASALLGAPAFAQTPAGDALRGKALFDNPAQASGNNGLMTCSSCHGSVEARRATISQNTGGAYDPYANIEFGTAMTRLVAALQGQQAMAAFRVLTAQQVSDIAAYRRTRRRPILPTRRN